MALGWRKDYLRYKAYYLNILNFYKKREDLRMFLEIMLSLVTISFFGIFALRPTFLTISALLKGINTKKETIVKMDTKIKNLQTAQNILSLESSRIPILDLSVPVSPQPQMFVHQIEGSASNAQVQVLGIRIDETFLKGDSAASSQRIKADPNFPTGTSSMGFSVSATGSFQNLFSFLKNLEDLRNPIRVDILGMNISQTEEGNILTLVITGKTPYLGGTK